MKRTIIALTVLAGTLCSTQASLILSDNFNYNNGPVAQPTAGSVNPGSPWLANSGSGSGKDIDVTNNTLIVTGSRSEDAVGLFLNQPYRTNGATTVLYSSYVLNCIGWPSSSGTYVSCFAGTNVYTTSGGAGISGFRARVWISQTNWLNGSDTLGANEVFVGIANCGYDSSDNSLGNTNYVWGHLKTNTTYTIVTRYVVATGASTLWVNPTQESDPSVSDPNLPLPVEPTSGAPTNGILNISGYEFRQASGGGTMLINSFKVGTQFTDVAGPHTPAVLTAPPSANTPMNTPIGPLAFSVQSAWLAATQITVTASSSNTGLVPSANIAVAYAVGDTGGTNRTVTVTPATGQQGATTISLIAFDGFSYTTNAFYLTVGAPSIAAIPGQITGRNTTTPPIVFAVADTEGDPLTLRVTSSNPSLVPTGNIVLGVAVPGVSSNAVVTPVSGQTGVSYITISVSDTHNTNTTTFSLTVTPPPLGVIYDENWAYTSFAAPNSLYLASGGSGGPWQELSGTDAGSIQVTNVTGSSGFVYLVYTNSESLSAALDNGAVYDGSQGYVFYTSFTLQCTLLPTYYGSYFFHFSTNTADTSAFHDKIFANVQYAGTNKFRVGIANFAGGLIAQNPRDLTTNATYAVVTRFNAATGDSTIWVNPVNEQSPSVTASDNPGGALVGAVTIRQPGDYYIGDQTIGPIKVGTAFSDVWAAPAQPHLDWMVDGSGNLVLNWANPLFVLQSASAVAGPYTDVAVAGPYATSISGQQYFRLRY